MKVHHLTFALLMYSPLVLASADWTPLFKSMQKDCTYDARGLSNSLKNIPSKYKQAVTSNKLINDKGYMVRKISVQNSIAFGYPLRAIEIGYPKEGSGDHVTLYFANKNFQNLKSGFYYQLNGARVYAGKKSQFSVSDGFGEDVFVNIYPTGYEVGSLGTTGLKFNLKDNSLTCYVDI